MKLELNRKSINRKQILKEVFKKFLFQPIIVEVWNFGKFIGTFDFSQEEINQVKSRELKVFQRAMRLKNARV